MGARSGWLRVFLRGWLEEYKMTYSTTQGLIKHANKNGDPFREGHRVGGGSDKCECAKVRFTVCFANCVWALLIRSCIYELHHSTHNALYY